MSRGPQSRSPIHGVERATRWMATSGCALSRLGQAVVHALEWELGELDALVLERMMWGGSSESAIEEGWLLRELMQRFGLGLDRAAVVDVVGSEADQGRATSAGLAGLDAAARRDVGARRSCSVSRSVAAAVGSKLREYEEQRKRTQSVG
jgi:hypothetical protein